MQSISRLIEDMYARNSRNDMNACLVKIFKSSILLPSALIPERLVMEHAVLIGKYFMFPKVNFKYILMKYTEALSTNSREYKGTTYPS